MVGNPLFFLPVLAATLLSAGTATALDLPVSRNAYRMQLEHGFLRYDTDKDGKLSYQEKKAFDKALSLNEVDEQGQLPETCKEKLMGETAAYAEDAKNLPIRSDWLADEDTLAEQLGLNNMFFDKSDVIDNTFAEFDDYDTNHDGNLTRREILATVENGCAQMDSADMPSPEELKQMIKNMPSPEELNRMMQKMQQAQ